MRRKEVKRVRIVTTVQFTNQTQRQDHEDEDKELHDILTKMAGLSTHDPTYAILYALCKHCFPDLTKDLTTPDLFKNMATVAYQALATQLRATTPTITQPPTTTCQPWPQPDDQSTTPDLVAFFQEMQTDGCSFCTLSGH